MFGGNTICRRVIVSVHAHDQMVMRNISRKEMLLVLANGDIIETYPRDPRGPSHLVLGYVGGRPFHVCVGVADAPDVCVVITAYEPHPDLWEGDYRTRKGARA